ncbi:MAG: membrane protein insertion efficiency factor YidD [Bacteroidota bacterium]
MTSLAIWLVRLYQIVISPLLPQNTCRFYPTCSHYAIDAMRKHGALSGLLRAIRRIMKCHPLHPGGYDPA